ncbi:thioredoxin family protein [Pedobacter sp. SG908]|uniref:thioredoxin family protein n=1 Tax=Pedobacter sp. SG908 TaxID=2587135 RepID=UPI00141F9520|nr:thioredoxin family protein [Pedobacter sp. SG908]NII83098.1 thioredoxin-related protein [Pedobacter sp. SG908]
MGDIYFMKMRLFSLLLIFSGLATIAVAQTAGPNGIKFFKGDWKSLLKESARQGKPIFVDVYTDWCLPCKRMEREVFVSNEVAQIYNSSFISYRLNAERGEGIKLADSYAVKAYPTYLFLDTLGNLVYRNGDYLKASEFITAGKEALNQFKVRDLAEMEARFKDGDRNKDFLKRLVIKRSQMGLDNAEILNVYVPLISDDERNAASTLHFLSENIGSTPSDALAVILKHINGVPKGDQQLVAQKLYDKLLYYALGRAVKDRRVDDAKHYLTYVEILRPLLAEKQLPSVDNLALHYYHAARDTSGLKKVGYRIAEKQMSIPLDSIRVKDKILFEQAMWPFLSGKEDSTKIPNFEEEKKLAAVQYSANIATILYTVSDFFKQDLHKSDKSLLDALKWMQFASQIYKKESIERLRSELEAISAGK